MLEIGSLGKTLAVILVLIFFIGIFAPASAENKNREYIVIDDKGETYKIQKDKLLFFNQLKKILRKDVITKNDYTKIRELLEAIIDKKLSDDQWKFVKHYIKIEHEKWLYIKKEKKHQLKNFTKALSINPIDYLPILYQPWYDINWRWSYSPIYGWVLQGGNPLLKGYYYLWTFSNYYVIELTFVFADEDHPDPTLDYSYDIVRLAQHGRIEDIETFYIYTDSNGNPTWLYLCYNGTGTHSRDQTFNVWFPNHYCDWVPASEFDWVNNRPKVYINTWNHLFGEYDTNTDLSDKTWYTYSIKEGTRADAEDDY